MTILLTAVSIFNSFALLLIYSRLTELLATYVVLHEDEIEEIQDE